MSHTDTAIWAAGGLNTNGLDNFLRHDILKLVILAIGILIIMRAKAEETRRVMVMSGIVIIGLAVIGLASGDNATNVSSWLVNLIIGNGNGG